MSLFNPPKLPKAVPPPNTPIAADASLISGVGSGPAVPRGINSLISSGGLLGLSAKARTNKRKLTGGGA